MSRARKTYRFDFSASHKLCNEGWTQKENQQVFGPCANPNWHGHNFQLYVTIEGPVLFKGMPIEERAFESLVDTIIRSHIHQQALDANHVLMNGLQATCENLLLRLWPLIEGAVLESSKLCKLIHLKLYETKNNAVELGLEQDTYHPIF